MGLSKLHEAHSPKTSWWIQPTREAFQQAAQSQQKRLHNAPKVGLVMLNPGAQGRISRPSKRKRRDGDV